MEKITTAEAGTATDSATATTEPLDAALDQKDFFEKAFNKENPPKEKSEETLKEDPKGEATTDNQGGDKTEEPKEDAKKEDPKGEATTDNQGGDKTEKQEVREGDTRKQKTSAREKVQRAIREMKQYREQAEKNAMRVLQLEQELSAIRAKKPEEMTVKDQVREAVIEDRLKAEEERVTNELHTYLESVEDPIEREKFEVDYDDHIPTLMEKDPWTIKTIGAIPEKYDVLREIFNAISNKQFTLNDWINETRSVKLAAIDRVRKQLRGETKAQKETSASTTQVKKLPDSVVPDETKHSAEPPIVSQEAAFRKAFYRG